ncbi:MAG: hypothetical protein Q7U54_19050 [Bacteroidales bacterium]|nr:hypothetical protein [Bacteroidales bacterium]
MKTSGKSEHTNMRMLNSDKKASQKRYYFDKLVKSIPYVTEVEIKVEVKFSHSTLTSTLSFFDSSFIYSFGAKSLILQV